MVSRESPDTPVSLHPSSVRNEMPVEFIGPRVSRARGWKMCELGRDEYIIIIVIIINISKTQSNTTCLICPTPDVVS